ncbi:MAG TPA: type II secretion system F family protein [Anaerolineales bacterium]|jgi:tight adherence protein C|nr:type II secretion system F family protein [Anaerolineales bacterium]HRF48280.1 type II secretion system F family protein [Anaerolineales bacterium]
METTLLFCVLGLVFVGALVLVMVGLRSPKAASPLQTRMAQYSTRERAMSLEDIEMAQPFSQRILLPIARRVGEFAQKFTPQATLKDIQHQLDIAGNPPGMTPILFYMSRIIMAGVGVGLFILLGFVSADPTSFFSFQSGVAKVLGISAVGGVLGYYIPTLMLRSRINRRKEAIIKAMPDALDLLTVCVEAGLGFDQAMQRVSEKWTTEVAYGFQRAIAEIRLGKVRREALRDMADRMDVPEMTSFVAALIQADQLGVSMAKVLRIQSDQMRVRRRQRAEKKAHEAPVKMLIPMAFLIFPSIYIVLLGPASMQLIRQFGLGAVAGQ